jgi:enterochelin esterase-like enzyme
VERLLPPHRSHGRKDARRRLEDGQRRRERAQAGLAPACAAPAVSTFLGLYVGKSDPTFVADNVRLDRELTSARVSYVFELYAGAHTTALWQTHAVQWLKLALDRLHVPE